MLLDGLSRSGLLKILHSDFMNDKGRLREPPSCLIWSIRRGSDVGAMTEHAEKQHDGSEDGMPMKEGKDAVTGANSGP